MKKPKVLIVEDDRAVSENVRMLLEAHGYAVVSADDGPTGIETALKELPSLILLDVMLPRLSGFDVCQALRDHGSTRSIPVIVLTALGKMADVERAFSCGAVDYIIKPFDNLHLVQKIQKFITK